VSGFNTANFEAVKAVVGCDTLAREEVTLKHSGSELRGECPLPEHQGNSPSFYCYPGETGLYTSWYCHRCTKGGDVIDLYSAMYGPYGNAVFAMEELAAHFNIKLWREEDLLEPWQVEVRRQERRAKAAFARGVQEYIFERDVMPHIRAVEDPAERAAVLKVALREAGLE
jgi:DNA primase